MINLSTPVKHKLTDLGVLSSKNRKPDENPGAQLSLEATLPLDIAELMFPGVRMFYGAKAAKQGALDGMALEQLTALGEKVGWIVWNKDHSAHTITIDFGIGGTSNPVISDCRLHRFRFRPEEGSVFVKYVAESPDVSEALFGKLAKLKSCDVQLLIDPPEVSQADIEDPVKPAPAHKPGAAERAAAGTKPTAKHKEPTKAEARKTAEEAFAAAPAAKLSDEAAWPFPRGEKPSEAPPQSVTTESTTRNPAGSRTARGREATAKALAAGATAK